MKIKDLNKKTESDLEKTLQDKRLGLRKFRFGVSGSKSKNTKEAKNTKKDIARVLTEIRQREIS
jgi:large subunit ribosomal protein L29